MSGHCTFSAPGWEEDAVVNRVASVVCHNPRPFARKDGYKWQLDSSNNWWVDRHEDGERWVVVYRYETPDVMAPLGSVLRYIFRQHSPSTKWNNNRNRLVSHLRGYLEHGSVYGPVSHTTEFTRDDVINATIKFLLQCGPGAECDG